MAGAALEDAVDRPEVEDGQQEEHDLRTAVPGGAGVDEEGGEHQGPDPPPPGVAAELGQGVEASAHAEAALQGLVGPHSVIPQEEDLLLEGQAQEPARVLPDPLLAPLI